MSKFEERVWWPYLDLARGVAALLVAISHLRGFIFVDFHSVASPGFVWSAFYFLTGFGHQAVMAFFVLSGFLVGGAVMSAAGTNRWSWSEYAIARMTRLWIVLIPALMLTVFWDSLGIAITASAFYSGGLQTEFNSGPSSDPTRYNIASLIGNIFFLQGIAVPSFGTNGPLWSLANEFWYYFLFPVIYCAATSSIGIRIICATIIFIACWLLPPDLMVYGVIWLFGVAAFAAQRTLSLSRRNRWGWLAVSSCLLMLALITSRTKSTITSDFFIGFAFSAMLVPLSSIHQSPAMVAIVARAGAALSYTLYLVHFPITAFLACYLLNNQRMLPSIDSAIVFLSLLFIVIGYSYAVYLLFESKTSDAKRAVSAYLRGARS